MAGNERIYTNVVCTATTQMDDRDGLRGPFPLLLVFLVWNRELVDHNFFLENRLRVAQCNRCLTGDVRGNKRKGF
jgi:hypothetical protein